MPIYEHPEGLIDTARHVLSEDELAEANELSLLEAAEYLQGEVVVPNELPTEFNPA